MAGLAIPLIDHCPPQLLVTRSLRRPTSSIARCARRGKSFAVSLQREPAHFVLLDHFL